jgi:hypothetical protein
MVVAILVWGIALTIGALILSPLLYAIFVGLHALLRQSRRVRPYMHRKLADGAPGRGAVLAIVRMRGPADHGR